MSDIPGYHSLNKIYESKRTSVYRAIRTKDNLPVMLKLLNRDYPSREELTEYKFEYELTSGLNLNGVIKSLELLPYKNSLIIIFEDFGAVSLKNFMETGGFTLKEFLLLASGITGILSNLYDEGIIHRDINPGNIVFNPDTGEIKLIDFGLARKFFGRIKSQKIEGNPLYISPEQTGRTSRPTDYRTDYYSLGAVFYEILTGKPPFTGSDLMELIHAHLAQSPVPPCLVNRNIPEVLSDIIMKLMAKNPEDRYRSPWGLKKDLDECLKQSEKTGKIESFTIGIQDIPSRLSIPEKLYGREKEINILLDSFEVIYSGGREMIFISGTAGIGKTSLFREIYRSVSDRGAYIISGKFEQFERVTPYSAIVRALQELIDKILTENEVEISLWKRKFLSVLGSNSQIIIDILPRLELIIGHQPAVEEVSSLEAQNRFNQVFENFIRIFCQSYHPLVICLDDLQWADSASLKLIEHIMSDKEIKYLFLTCAYRDDEIDHVHPLKRTVDILKKSIKIKEIHLNSLDIEDITQLISDTIYAGGDYVRELSEMIKKNTEGNPFFIKQYLKTLYDKKLLLFNTDSRCWQWDLNRIKEIVTENVAELMAQKIRNLPSETKEVLLASACLGNTFDLITLSIIYEKTLSEISCSLLPAIEESLILPVSDLEFEDRKNILSKTFYKKYKFLHDRIQQYVHSFTGEYEKKKVNLLTGRQLFHNLSGEELDRRLFEIADHFNTAKELITEEKEKIEFIRLNLMAGKKAKKSIAYREALKYIKQCFEALPDRIWTDYYELAFDLYREGAEIEYFNGHYEESQKLIKFALTRSKTPFEMAELYSLLLVQLTILAEHEEAIGTGIKALSLLGIDLTETELEQAIDKEISIINNNPGDRSIASLIDMQIMTDAEKKQAVKLLSYMAGPAYYTNKKLFCLIAGKIVSLSLKYGNISESCTGYSMYGMVENSLTGNYKTGYDFNLLAMKLSEKFRAPAQRCIVSNIFGNFIFHWVRPLKEKDTINIEGYRAGLEGGELEFAGYCLCHRGEDYFYSGNKCLKDMLSDITDYIHFAEKTVNKMAISILTCLTIIITNLSGFTKDRLSFDTEEIREEEFMNDCHRNKNHRVLCEYYTLKAQVLYLYGKTHEALTCIIKAKELSEYIWGLFISAEYNFYYSLILADLYDRCDEERKKEYEEEIKINQRQMKIRADNCPENFLHKYLLVEAEIARLRGHTVEAIDYYTMAINLAKEHEFIKDEILARERAGKFWDKRGNKDYAGLHLRKAFYGYSIIGAMSKIEDMKEKYGEYLSEISHKKIPDTEMISPSSSSSELLDLGTVIKASHIISGEIVLENLINKTMVLLIEHSGAQRGFLILENDGILNVEAQIEGDKHRVIESIDLKKCDNISVKIVTYVERTRDTFILNDASRDGNFINDPYILRNKVRSLLCMPLIHQDKLTGILYLENNIMSGIFTENKIEMLNILSSQLATSIENSKLYRRLEEYNRTLEHKVTEKTAELKEAKEAAEAANKAKSKSLAELKDRESYLELQFNRMPSGCIVWDNDLTIRSWNPSAEKIFGYSSEEATGKNITDLLLPADIKEDMYNICNRLLKGDMTASSVNDNITKHGNRIICEWTNTPLIDSEGNVHGVISMVQDITERRMAEEALCRSEDKFRTIFESNSAAMAIIEPDTTISMVNDAYCQMSGYKKEEVIGMSWTEQIPPEDLERMKEYNRRRLINPKDAPDKYEFTFYRKDGEIRHALMSVALIPEIKNIIVSFTDITERRQAEEALKLSEANYRNLFQNAPIGIFHSTIEGLFIRVNPALVRILAYSSPEELISSISDMNTQIYADKGKRSKIVELMLKQNEWVHDEIRWRRKDGNIIIADFTGRKVNNRDGNITYLEGFIQDITARKRIEEELSESEERWRTIINTSPDGIAFVTTDGKIKFMSDKLLVMYGYDSLDEVTGRNMFDFLDITYHEKAITSLQEMLKGNYTGFSEYLVIKKDGTRFFVEINAEVIRDREGNPVNIFFIERDITERKKFESALIEARIAAEEANRAKSLFLANMSHELRTPLNAILGYAQLFQQDTQLSEDYKRGINIIEKSGKHLLKLINDILDLAKIEAGKIELEKEKFKLKNLLHFVEELIIVKAKAKELIFNTHYSEDLPFYVEGDKKKLSQTLINILDNAVKFTQKGSITFRVEKQKGKIMFAVEDTGPGIPEESLEEIFSPFTQLGDHLRKAEGTGLGLTITRNLVKLMGGKLKVESLYGKGSKFRFEIELPEISGLNYYQVSNEDIITGYKGRKRRILVVDDKFENRMVLSDILNRSGFYVEEAELGIECLGKLDDFMPDLIFMDLIMPHMDGYESTRKIRENEAYKEIKIIAISAGKLDKPVNELIEIGFDDWITKPFLYNDLFTILMKHLRLEPEYKKEEEKFILPPAELIENLYNMSIGSNFKLIRQELEKIKDLNKDYMAFYRKVKELADGFEIENMRSLLEKYLEAVK